MESALENSEIINEKNRIIKLIKAYFPDRDCFRIGSPSRKNRQFIKFPKLTRWND